MSCAHCGAAKGGAAWRSAVAWPAVHLVGHAPVLLAAGTAVAAAGWLPGVWLALAAGLLAGAVVYGACQVPVLRTTVGTRRPVRDACWERVDRIADWAGWSRIEPGEVR